MEKFKLSINSTSFKKKPTSEEVAKIYNSFDVCKININDLKKCILSGNTIRPAVLDENHNFISQQVFFVDVDNTKIFSSISRNIIRAKELNVVPSLIYMTFTSNHKNQKHRLVFVSDKLITDIKIRDEIQRILTKTFCGDTATNDYKRMFFGGKMSCFYSPNSKINYEMLKEI